MVCGVWTGAYLYPVTMAGGACRASYGEWICEAGGGREGQLSAGRENGRELSYSGGEEGVNGILGLHLDM